MASLVRCMTACLASVLLLAGPCGADDTMRGTDVDPAVGGTAQPARGKLDRGLMRTLQSAAGAVRRRQSESVSIEIGEVLEDSLVTGGFRRLLQMRGCNRR